MSANDNPPAGKSSDLQIRFGKQSTPKGEVLIVDFGADISWVAFTKEKGTEFAQHFLDRLAELK